MPLLTLKDVRLAFGGPPLLDGVDLQLEEGERACLLGRNGSGKSTLLKLLSGELKPDAGQVVRAQGLRAARLEQDLPPDAEGNAFALAQSGAPHAPPHQIERVLSLLDLDPEADFSALSGGLRRRVLLARALAPEPDLLLLDEPTNHLDIEGIAWLEDFFSRWSGTLLFVTHDRAFLRRLATRILELDRGRLSSWSCTYESYLERRQALLEAEASRQQVFDRKLAQEEVWIRQGIQARRTRNEGRVRALEKMRQERRARRLQAGQVRLQIQQAERSGDLVVEADNISFAYGKNAVVRDFSTLVHRGDRIGVAGPNGSGKTTLLRLLTGELAPQTGRVRLGAGVHLARFGQLREQLELEKSAAENIAQDQEFVTLNGQRRHVMGYLQDFLFSPERARTPAWALSGGERNRLLLARLFCRPANLVVLDEPTNDLDVETLELLEERLLDYQGTLLLVSHDRAFLDNVVTSLLVLEADGRVGEYAGGYSDWLMRQPEPAREKKTPERTVSRPRERERTRKLSFNEKRELEHLPERIEELEGEQRQLHGRLADPALYQQGGAEVGRLQQRLGEVEAELETAYARWSELAELEV